MKVNNKTEFNKTLNLPKQVIAIKGNQVKKEDYILDKIQDVKKYQFVSSKNIKNGGKRYRIFEMPTEIENKLSSTVILNKILKDFVVKSKLMFKNSVKHELIFTSSNNMEQIYSIPNDKTKLQELFRVRLQKRKELSNIFKSQIVAINHLGSTINYDINTTTTVKPDFEIELIKKFYELYKQNRLKKIIKSTRWCTKCATVKRKHDIVYKKTEVDNYYVLYRVEEDKGKFAEFKDLENIYFVASTIEPWLMMSSQNIAIASDLEYSIVEIEKLGKHIYYIVASDYVSDLMQSEFYTKYEVKRKFKAEELKDIQCMNPIDHRKRIGIILTQKDKVTYSKNDSTGVRIVSSGHTYMDYLILKDKKKEELRSVINEFGIVSISSSEYQNLNYHEIGDLIINYLNESNLIYTVKKINIMLPFCKTCNEKTTYRVINDWYAVKNKDDKILDETMDNLIPKISASDKYKREELSKGVDNINNTREILISDKSILGTPIPVFYCADCGADIIDDKSVDILCNMIKSKGSDTWYKQTPEEILQGQIICRNCGCTFLFKENATLNKFFEYICINLNQINEIKQDPETSNIVIENKQEFLDSLKALSFAENTNENISDFDMVLIHSNVKEDLDVPIINEKVEQNEQNEETNVKNNKTNLFLHLFKNKANLPKIEIEKQVTDTVSNYGTDILRLWAAYFSNKERITLNKQTLININKKYKNIRKSLKFILSNLYDFHPAKNYIEISERNGIDKCIYSELYKVAKEVKEAYYRLEFNKIYKLLTSFGENILCKLYYESIKYKLYILNANDKKRRSIQSNMYDIIMTLSALLYPLIPFTIEEIWPLIYHKSAEEERIVFSNDINLKDIQETEKEEINRWKKIFAVKEKLDAKIRIAQKKKIINHTSEIKIILDTNSYTKKFVEDNYDDIVESVYISSIEANISDNPDVRIEKEPGTQCVRCLRYTNEIGKNFKYRYLCPKCAEILEQQEGK